MKNMFGWTGNLLRVDLSARKTFVEPSGPYLRQFLGGRGMGRWILFKELDPSVGPLDPENKLVISAGPLAGTMAPMSCRLSVETKNLQAGGVCSSNVGGHVAPELKYAGYDAIIIEGKCHRLSWLLITDREARILDAHHLEGMRVSETEEAVRRETGDSKLRVASIGPAGEKMAFGACLIADGGHAAGRGGVGAIMGSKGLKAIGVRGTGSVHIANPSSFMDRVGRCLSKLDVSPAIRQLREGGTHLGFGVGAPTEAHTMPVRNVRNNQDEWWPLERVAAISEPALKRYEISRLACFNCPVACTHYYRVTDGPYRGAAALGIHANAVRAFGPNLDMVDPAALVKCQELCNELGLDVDSVAACLGWAFECYERGILSEDETGGLDLSWGNERAAVSLIEQIAYRQGLGSLLSHGVMRASGKLGRGSEAWAMHIRGADMSEGCLRGNKAWAFGIAVSLRAGGHLDGAPNVPRWGISPEVGESIFKTRTAGDPSAYAGQEQLVSWTARMKAAVDALGVCYLGGMWTGLEHPGPDDYAALYTHATGEEMTAEDLMLAGRRIRNIEKAFNTLHAGFRRNDDTLPVRFFELPIGSGPFKGEVLDREKWSELLDRYYRLEDWDPATGWQTSSGLADLGLDEVADRLRAHGRLIM